MRHGLGMCAVALSAIVASATAASGAQKCALPAEVTSIQVAAVQQDLMVAALTCHDIVNYNAFQTSFSNELRRSDRRLKSMFIRLEGGHGESEYHAFKTRLANNSSIRSIHDNAGYCRQAQLVFAAALNPNKPTLDDFVSGVAVQQDGPVDSCDIRVATGLAGTKSAPNVVPKPNPLRVASDGGNAPLRGSVASAPVAVQPAQQTSAPAVARSK